MFPISGVERHGNGFDENVVVSKAGFGTVGGELGISWAYDLDGCLRCHYDRRLSEPSFRSEIQSSYPGYRELLKIWGEITVLTNVGEEMVQQFHSPLCDLIT